jgi:hypothetical protein
MVWLVWAYILAAAKVPANAAPAARKLRRFRESDMGGGSLLEKTEEEDGGQIRTGDRLSSVVFRV